MLISFGMITLETLYRQIKRSITKKLNTDPTKHKVPFITVDTSIFGISSVLIQAKYYGNLDVNSYTSRNFTIKERKYCNTYRDLIGIDNALTFVEFILHSPEHFKNVPKDRQVLPSFKKKQICHQCFILLKLTLTLLR